MSGRASDAWLVAFAALLGSARGNDRFVGLRGLAHLSKAWVQARAISPTSVPLPQLASSGMPVWTAWAELQAEQEIGDPRLATASPPTDGDDARSRLGRREQAAGLLAAAPRMHLGGATLALRRAADRDHNGDALVSIQLDRPAADGTLVRLAVDGWVRRDCRAITVMPGHDHGRHAMDGQGDSIVAGADFIDLLSRACALPAPAIAVQLAAVGGFTIERVSRGVVGPVAIVEPSALGLPPQLQPVLVGSASSSPPSGAAVLVLRLEELSPSLARTSANDCFDVDGHFIQMVEALPQALSALRGFAEVRLVASSSALPATRAFVAARGTPTVVTAARELRR